TTLDEILDELSQEVQAAIIKHMMDKSPSNYRAPAPQPINKSRDFFTHPADIAKNSRFFYRLD
ncbi:hypothetical protein, partial [Eikenella corrodens]